MIQIAEPSRRVEHLLSYLDHPERVRTPAGQDHPARYLSLRLRRFMGDMLKQFYGARLHDVAQDLFGQPSRFGAADGHDLDILSPGIVVKQERCDTPVTMLDLIRLLNRNT